MDITQIHVIPFLFYPYISCYPNPPATFWRAKCSPDICLTLCRSQLYIPFGLCITEGVFSAYSKV